MVLGSEGASDFGVSHTDFLLPFDQERVAGETILLWGLVYHDAILRYSVSNATKTTGEDLQKQWLAQMVWGYQMRWYFASRDEWEQSRQAFAESFYVDHWLMRIATSEMIFHRFLYDHGEETMFENGLRLIANFSPEDPPRGDLVIPAWRFQIVECAAKYMHPFPAKIDLSVPWVDPVKRVWV
ncbi:hypothetical protein P0Y35_04665 [Kiritimatiellaeota bacterium B1221]|nr:hypothetical protein [Kiritimatiellaeota bacterium B1221]